MHFNSTDFRLLLTSFPVPTPQTILETTDQYYWDHSHIQHNVIAEKEHLRRILEYWPILCRVGHKTLTRSVFIYHHHAAVWCQYCSRSTVANSCNTGVLQRIMAVIAAMLNRWNVWLHSLETSSTKQYVASRVTLLVVLCV